MSTFHNPFLKRRPNPKRSTPRRVGNGRVRLHGEDMTDLRRQAFERSGGRCEAERFMSHPVRGGEVRYSTVRCPSPITWESMELSHERHGPNRSDSLETVKASCRECHKARHNPKSCKRRPGKIMPIKDAKQYWSGKVCFCDGPKKPAESFCPDCSLKLSEQTLHTLQHASNPDDYRQALAQAEIEVLQWRAQ